MNDDATSLSRLNDIVEPPPIPWWPPAPGWYVVLAVVALALLALAVRQWARWRANAYRREALRALQSASTVGAVSEVLRRAALAIAPRSTMAGLTGSAWPAWLAEQSPEPLPPDVREALAADAYRDCESPTDVPSVRAFAEAWVRRHRATKGVRD